MKKILCGFIAVIIVMLFASCSCAGSCANGNIVETRPERTVSITPDFDLSMYPYYINSYHWINEESGDTIDFETDGQKSTFRGKIDGDLYSGIYTLTLIKDKVGYLKMGVTLDGSEKEVNYTIHFITSSEIEITTNKGKSESYVADWTLE